MYLFYWARKNERKHQEYLKVFALFGPLVPVYFATDNFLRVCGKGKYRKLKIIVLWCQRMSIRQLSTHI